MLNPLPWPEFGPVNPKAIVDLELTGLWFVGTTGAGEFLPVGVREEPRPHQPMLDALAVGTVEKVDRAALPPGVTVEPRRHDSVRDDFSIEADRDFVLRILTFCWPGWTAYLDGARVPVRVADPEGLIEVAIPAGTHTLSLRLEDTPPRTAGWAVSGVAALLTLAVLFGTRRGRGEASAARGAHDAAGPGRMLRPYEGRGGAGEGEARVAAVMLALLVAGAGARLAWDAALRHQAATRRPLIPGAQVQRYTRFDNGLALLAYDLPVTTARAGEAVPLAFYWQVTRRMPQPASVFVHLYAPDGSLWGQSDKPDPIEFFPTTRWALGVPMRDEHRLLVAPGAPPGAYTLAVGTWDRATGQRSRPLGPDGALADMETVALTGAFQVAP
jgi:hypothetical protein